MLAWLVSAADRHEEKLNTEPKLGTHGDVDERLPQAVKHPEPQQAEVQSMKA